MLRWFFNRKGQSTGEYALIFAIVLGAVVAMQTYVKKELQGRIKDGADYMTRGTLELGNTSQYDPYDLSSDYSTTRASSIRPSYVDGHSTTVVDREEALRQAGGYTEHSAAEAQQVEE